MELLLPPMEKMNRPDRLKMENMMVFGNGITNGT